MEVDSRTEMNNRGNKGEKGERKKGIRMKRVKGTGKERN